MATKTIPSRETPKFIPCHFWGDKDFGGHGPKINVNARLSVVNENQLYVTVYMYACETKSDWTAVKGSASYCIYNGNLEGVQKITRIISDCYSSDSYTDFDHANDVREQTPYELVDKFIVTGDTSGNDAGINTGVVVRLNPIQMEFTPKEDGTICISNIEQTPKFVPPHVNGDKDFGGHGPNIDISTFIDVKNGNEIWATVNMRAIETKSDWTEANGSKTFLIYKHDRQIAQILSNTISYQFFQDYDHYDNSLKLPEGSLVKEFIIVGDTKGNEAGTKTGVVVCFNPITFRQK